MVGADVMVREGLIFDLDGTLVDSLPGIASALNATLAGEGFAGHPERAIRGFVGDGLETTVRRSCPAGVDEATVARLVGGFRRVYAQVWKDGTRVYPGISSMLEDLNGRGVPLAVLSNKSHAFTVEMVAEIFAAVGFSAVLGLRPGMPPKPDPAGAREIAGALGLDPGRCLVIGDSTMDVDTAKHAGMASCAVSWGYHDTARLQAAGANAVVADIDALHRWILAWMNRNGAKRT